MKGFTTPNRKLAVDLVAILPGGSNGGAKRLALDLLAGLSDQWDITCFCQVDSEREISGRLGTAVRIVSLAQPTELEASYDKIVATEGPFAVNFFPMQRVSLHRADIPAVSLVHDVQFADLPGNFAPEELAERQAAFESCVDHSDLIVTVSHYSKSRIEAIAGSEGRRIRVIYNSLSETPPHAGLPDPIIRSDAGYFLYPANFWPHKNHRRLVAGYRAYRQRTSSPLDLMLTGAPETAPPEMMTALADAPGVHVLGYVADDVLHAVLKQARLLVFPSLYEGFGMPVVEAMAAGIPVACSTSASLPEIAGSAALFFDGLDSDAIADALARLAQDATLRDDLIAAGRTRLAELGGFSKMVDEYGDALAAAIDRHRHAIAVVSGFDDRGWARRDAAIDFRGSDLVSQLQLRISLPAWAPLDRQSISFTAGDMPLARRTLLRGQSKSINLELPPGNLSVAITASQAFRADAHLDCPLDVEMAYKVEAASLTASGKRSAFWPTPQTKVIPAAVVALVGIIGSQAGGRVVSAVGSSQRDPDYRLISKASGNKLHFDFRSDIPRSAQAGPEVTRISLPSSVGDPSVTFASGCEGITFRAKEPMAPEIITKTDTVAGFSVIVPSYNQGRFIGRTIESILRQDNVVEVLVLDGGSSDETIDVLSKFGSRIQWWSGKDGGQADAVNRGMGRAKGEYIAWINSDDTYADGALAHVAAVFSENAAAGVVFGSADHIDEVDAVIDPYPVADLETESLFDRCLICQPAAFFRRKVAVDHGGLRNSLRYCLDYEFWLRLSHAGVKFHHTSRLLAHSRMYAQNKTMAERPQAFFETADMIIRLFRHRQGQWAENFANAAADFVNEPYAIPRDLALQDARRLGEAVWPAPISGETVS